MSRILLIEDDPQIGDGLCAGLAHYGMTVDWLRSGKHAVEISPNLDFDAAILDLGLPDVDGLAVLSAWRARECALPVLILTARDALNNRVGGLNAGADDYLIKPFELAEVAARLNALIRRSQGRAQTVITQGRLRLDSAARQVYWNNQPIELSAKELTIIEILIAHPGKVYSRQDLEEKLYGWTQDVESNAVEVHIHKLRKKIAAAVIVTQRGVGYRLGDC